MFKKSVGFIILALVIAVPAFADDVNDVNVPVPVDELIGLPDVNAVNDMIEVITYDGNDYVVAENDLTLGTTTRWYIDANGVEIQWVDGDPAPAATVSGTSNPKVGDIGANADNFQYGTSGDAGAFSSIDGIDFQKTIFPTTSNLFFIIERGGNDKGNMQAIYADGSLGEEIVFNKAPYADTGENASGQPAKGVVFKTVEPAVGVRINASGHDCLSISIPTPDAYLTGVADINVVDGNIVSINHGGTEYLVAEGDLTLGTTTRWYFDANGVETNWVDGDPAPAATVNGTSNPKVDDIGAHADNFLVAGNNMSSIDGIDFQQTLFEVASNTFFIFERGGNDKGTMQAILEDGTLGEPVAFNKAPYAKTGFKVGQDIAGVAFKTKEPVMGVRINASGHDCLSISIPTPIVEEEPVEEVVE